MSDTPSPAPQPRKLGWRRLFHGKFLVVSIIVHLLFFGGAAYLVVQTIAPRKKNFTAPPAQGSSGQKAVEHQVKMAKKQKSMNAPAPTKRVVTTGLSRVSLPDMPDMPSMSDTISFTPGTGLTPGTGFGAGGGGGSGSGGGRGLNVPFFGLRAQNGGALKGTFYDLKQRKNGKPSEFAIVNQDWKSTDENPANDGYRLAVERVIDSGFGTASLNKFFAGPTPLYTTQVYIPSMSATEGPKAFNLPNVQPRRWIVIYTGTIIAPESGRFRFVGVGDDWMAVRFSNRLALNHGFYDREPQKNKFNPEGMPEGDGGLMNMEEGAVFDVKAGNAYPIDILVGEGPGGEFFAFLLLKKEGETYRKDSRGNPIYPIFKLAPSSGAKPNGLCPVFAPDTTWSVWKGKAETTGTGSTPFSP